MATRTISPRVAHRVAALLAYHQGDLAVALHDCRLTLQSLGHYTDRRTEAAADLLAWLATRTPERLPLVLEQLAAIAATHTQEAQS